MTRSHRRKHEHHAGPGAPGTVRARPGRGLRRPQRHAGTLPGGRTTARHRRRRRRLLLAPTHRDHLPGVIKIDRSIVAGLDTDPVRTKLMQSLVDFGHGCDVRVVVEGIETADEAAALRALGVDYGQAWHYGRPGPPEALSKIAPVVIPAPRRSHAEALTA